MRRLKFLLAVPLLVLFVSQPAAAAGVLQWPVQGPVIRGFDGPLTPYSSGHRGIDIAVPLGTPVVAPADGTVAFAGPVGGSLFISIDHAGGIRSTFSWLSSMAVKKGAAVEAGMVVGYSGQGHPGSITSHLHLGTRVDGNYVDPLTLLVPLDVSKLIRLAPLV